MGSGGRNIITELPDPGGGPRQELPGDRHRREHYGWNSPQADVSGRSSGQHAFGMVPRAHVRPGLRAFDMVPGAAFGSESPSATGGGSIGYNSGRDS